MDHCSAYHMTNEVAAERDVERGTRGGGEGGG